MAAPHVAGAIALLWGQAPTSSAAQLIDLVMKNTDSVFWTESPMGVEFRESHGSTTRW